VAGDESIKEMCLKVSRMLECVSFDSDFSFRAEHLLCSPPASAFDLGSHSAGAQPHEEHGSRAIPIGPRAFLHARLRLHPYACCSFARSRAKRSSRQGSFPSRLQLAIRALPGFLESCPGGKLRQGKGGGKWWSGQRSGTIDISFGADSHWCDPVSDIISCEAS
jgi:hypothetical protein